MKIKGLMLFVYDFPHKKTQDFLFRLIVEGYHINYCIAAPWKKLNIKPATIRTDQKHEGLCHPRLICQRFKIKYLSFDHDDKKMVNFITNNPVDTYLVAGARILSPQVIQACKGRILNIHPGLLPDVRGLDTFLWSIYYKKPLGISAHFIVPKIDSGFLIYKEKLPLYRTDTPFDVTLRLLEYQSEVLVKALNILQKTQPINLKSLSSLQYPYNTKMDPVLERKTIGNFNQWLERFTND